MGETEDLPTLPWGWSWEGLAGPELAWLGKDFLEDLVDGPLPEGVTHSTWVLHAQFFRPAEVPPEPEPVDLEERPGFGFGVHAPARWQRITWAEAAARKGVPLQGPAAHNGLEIPPCDGWEALLDDSDAANGVLPPHVTPSDFVWPTEGSLGKTDLEALVPILAAHTGSTRMIGRFSPVTSSLHDEAMIVFSFNLATMLSCMLATGEQEFSPELWWPEDRAWVVWTDYDLMGTRVFGSKDLIDALRASPDVETLDWHQVRLRPPSPARPPNRLQQRIQKLMAEQKEAEANAQADKATPRKTAMDRVDVGDSPERLIFTEVQRGTDGVPFSMVVAVELGALTAGREVASHYVSGFDDLVLFFADLAENWRGWNGTRNYESMEHDLRLEAVHTGSHVELHFTLQDPESSSAWSVRGKLTLDAGEELSRASEDLRDLLRHEPAQD